MQDAGPGAFTPKIPITKQEVQNLTTLITLLDPSGIIQDYDIENREITTIKDTLQNDKDNLEKAINAKDYGAAALHAGTGILGILSLIPLIGKGFKAVRLARLAKLQKPAKKLEKQLDKMPDAKAKEISAKVKEFNKEVDRVLKNVKGTQITATSKTLSKLGEALPVKKVDISKLTTSVDRVKSLSAAAKTLFKGKVTDDEVIIFRGISGDSFDIPGGTKQDLIDAISLYRKGWELPGLSKYGGPVGHEKISNALSGMQNQFFSDSADAAAEYAIKSARDNRRKSGAIVAVRMPKFLVGEFINFSSTATAGNPGVNLEIPLEYMRSFKDSGDIGAIFF